MSSRPLNNDRTNYLIWRYLQEHGHAQTAARFQMDWGHAEPDNLSFSPYIKTHALVYLLQKGLRYHELESTINSLQPIFGPENASAQASKAIREEDSATTRKHPRDSSVNGNANDSSSPAQAPAPKRTRRGNGQTSGANGSTRAAAKSGDAMDIDETATKREPASTNSPPPAVATAAAPSAPPATSTTAAQHAQADTEMELDPDQKSKVFQRDAQGQNPEATVAADEGVHAPAASNANLGTSSGGVENNNNNTSSGENDRGVDAAASGAENGILPSPAANATAAATTASAAAAQPEQNLQEQQQDQQQQQQQQQQDSALVEEPEKAAPAEMAVQAAPIPTLDDGFSVAVQSKNGSHDKVADLGPETAVLKVPGSVTAQFSPRDPSLLALGGDAQCRLYSLPSSCLLTRSGVSTTTNANESAPNSTAPNGHVNGIKSDDDDSHAVARPSNGVASVPQPHTLDVDPKHIVDLYDDAANSTVTAMAWSPDGERIAVARRSKSGGRSGKVTIHLKDGGLIDELPGGMESVANLYWNPSGNLLLGVNHTSNGTTTLMVWGTNGTTFAPLQLDTIAEDATWCGDQSFVVCGDNVIARAEVQENGIGQLQKEENAAQSHDWSRISYDAVTQTTAITSGESGTLALLSASRELQTTQAHQSQITAVEFQPLANPSALAAEAPRLLATGAVDGSIKLWDAKKPFEVVHSLSLQKSTPTLGISFTPDGYLVAAASWDSLTFWNADSGGAPRAIWNGPSSGWQTDSVTVNGHQDAGDGDTAMTDGDENNERSPSISWDADGGKIAFLAKEQVAIVSFRR